MEIQSTEKSEILTTELLEEEKEGGEKLTVIDFKMVTFSLAGKDYAIDIMKVKEIAKAARFTYVPNSLPFVIGVYNLRGEIIPIIDLRLFFNIDVPESSSDVMQSMIIISVEDLTFGVIVDAIDKVVGIRKSNIQPPHPLFGDINIKYIYGVVENSNRLYILLDVDKIFGNTSNQTSDEKYYDDSELPQKVTETATNRIEESVPVADTAVFEKKSVVSGTSTDEYKFLVSGLESLKKFYVTALNEQFIKQRYDKWIDERGVKNIQFKTAEDADSFLTPFWSQHNGSYWSKSFAEKIGKLLPENTAHQIVVWNPGCGKGFETFSLACVLKKRYPNSQIRIYAHDINLLDVSNAPLLSVPDQYAQDWFSPYLTKKADGTYTFSSEIKDLILFEYHDCVNTNALPVVDIIFSRDVISFLEPHSQESLLSDFDEKLKGNGIVILGEHEILDEQSGWKQHEGNGLKAYTKR